MDHARHRLRHSDRRRRAPGKVSVATTQRHPKAWCVPEHRHCDNDTGPVSRLPDWLAERRRRRPRARSPGRQPCIEARFESTTNLPPGADIWCPCVGPEAQGRSDLCRRMCCPPGPSPRVRNRVDVLRQVGGEITPTFATEVSPFPKATVTAAKELRPQAFAERSRRAAPRIVSWKDDQTRIALLELAGPLPTARWSSALSTNARNPARLKQP